MVIITVYCVKINTSFMGESEQKILVMVGRMIFSPYGCFVGVEHCSTYSLLELI